MPTQQITVFDLSFLLHPHFSTGDRIALNVGPAPNLHGAYNDLGHNLIGGNPLLAPLDKYRGALRTQELLPGSQALGQGGPLTTLTQAVKAGATALHVANAATIASTPGHYLIRIGGERAMVTAVNLASNTLTLQAALTRPHAVNAAIDLPVDERGSPRRATAADIGAYQTYARTAAVTVAKAVYDPSTQTVSQLLTLVDNGSGVLKGACLLALTGLPSGVTLLSAQGSFVGTNTSFEVAVLSGVPVLYAPSYVAAAPTPGKGITLSLSFSVSSGTPFALHLQILN